MLNKGDGQTHWGGRRGEYEREEGVQDKEEGEEGNEDHEQEEQDLADE